MKTMKRYIFCLLSAFAHIFVISAIMNYFNCTSYSRLLLQFQFLSMLNFNNLQSLPFSSFLHPVSSHMKAFQISPTTSSSSLCHTSMSSASYCLPICFCIPYVFTSVRSQMQLSQTSMLVSELLIHRGLADHRHCFDQPKYTAPTARYIQQGQRFYLVCLAPRFRSPASNTSSGGAEQAAPADDRHAVSLQQQFSHITRSSNLQI